jgi:hypothetical protein
MSQALEQLARRVKDDPFFLAAPLARYAAAEGLDDAGLAARLGCVSEALTGLRLCRNPDPQPPNFWNDVQLLAGQFLIDSDILAEVVRYGQNLIRLAASPAGTGVAEAGFILAARDRKSADQQEGNDSAGPKTGGTP